MYYSRYLIFCLFIFLNFNFDSLQLVQANAGFFLECPSDCSQVVDAGALKALKEVFTSKQKLLVNLPNLLLLAAVTTNFKTEEQRHTLYIFNFPHI